MTDDSLLQLPEVTASRGGIRYDDPGLAAALTRRRERAITELCAALDIPVVVLDSLNERNGESRLTVRPGHWEYAVRDADGEIGTGGTSYEPRPYLSAQEAFNDRGLDQDEQIVRRWVVDAGEWEELPL